MCMVIPPRIVLATDHAGFPLKEAIKEHLISKKVDVIDVGTFSEESVDYPEIIRKGCSVVLEESIPGLIFGGSGIGESMAANKVKGIRSARCTTVEDAEMSRRHNNANILCLASDVLGDELIRRIVCSWIETEFEGGGRHERRVRKIEIIEKQENPSSYVSEGNGLVEA